MSACGYFEAAASRFTAKRKGSVLKKKEATDGSGWLTSLIILLDFFRKIATSCFFQAPAAAAAASFVAERSSPSLPSMYYLFIIMRLIMMIDAWCELAAAISCSSI